MCQTSFKTSTHPTTQMAANSLSDQGNSSSSSHSRSGAAGAGLNGYSRHVSGKFISYIYLFFYFTLGFFTDKLCLQDMSYKQQKKPTQTGQRLETQWHNVSLYIYTSILFILLTSHFLQTGNPTWPWNGPAKMPTCPTTGSSTNATSCSMDMMETGEHDRDGRGGMKAWDQCILSL